MLRRICALGLNTYRESVRARLLHGLFVLAVATAGYALVVGAYAFRDTLRVVSDVGSASVSAYAIVVSVVLGATGLYRELEHKTVFSILTRPVRRWEYLVGKFFGSWLVVAAFVLANVGVLLLAVARLGGRSTESVLGVGLGSLVAAMLAAWRWPHLRSWLPLGWAVTVFGVGAWLAGVSPDDQNVLLGAAMLTLCEVAIVIALATAFASFSSPVLTALFTLGVFAVGRSADTLANLPYRVFGKPLVAVASGIARVVPNLMVYIPPRPLLTGEVAEVDLLRYFVQAGLQAVGWCTVLLTLAAVVFRRRDFL